MRLNKQQLKVDILFIMSTRSSKYWRGKELCQYLSQLGHEQPTPKKIKYVLTELVEMKVLERVRVKPQWTLYSYKLTGLMTHETIMFTRGEGSVVRRSAADNIW